MDRLLAVQSTRLLRRVGVEVKREEFEVALCSHPDYPSLLALTETLELYGVEYAAVKMKPEDMEVNGFPFLAHLKEKQGNYVVVTGCRQGKVEYIDDEKGKRREERAEFCNKWEGVAVYAASGRGEEESRLYSRRRMIFLAAVAFFVVWYFVWGGAARSLADQGYGMVKMAGLLLSCMLLFHEWGSRAGWMQKVCHFHKKSDCDKVLGSGASHLFGVSLAEMGMVYFAGGFLYLCLGNGIQVLLYLSVCAFPYTLFSLWYQFGKVRRICPFCMGVVVCLWGEAVFAAKFLLPLALSMETIGQCAVLLCCFAGVAGMVYVLKLLIKYKQKAHRLEVSYLKIKREEAVNRALQLQMPELDPEYSDNDILLHEGKGKRKVIVVVSPFCGPCAGLHEKLEALFRKYVCDFTVILRFIGAPGIEKDDINRVALGLIEIYHSQGREAFRKALAAWFRKRETGRLPAGEYSSGTVQTLTASVEWCRRMGIHSTPLILTENRILSSYYGVEDLIFGSEQSI